MTTQPESITFNYSVPVEVTPAPFVALDTLRHLDVAALAQADHAEFEVGYFDTGCRQMVHAVVEKGTVIELRVEPCAEAKAEPAPPELQGLLEAACRRAKRGRKPWKPVPVQRFLSQARRGITIDSITCVRICIWGFCFVCCTTIDPNTPFWCGDRVIIHRD